MLMEVFKTCVNEKVPSESCKRIFQMTFSGIFFFSSFARSIKTVRSPSDAYSIKRYRSSSLLSNIPEINLMMFG